MKRYLNKKAFSCLMISIGMLWGVNGNAATTATVKVTIMAPLPCTLNANKQINVDFGDEIMTTRIDSKEYRQPVNYELDCKGQTKNAMKLQIKGDGVVYDGSTVLRTSRDGLGIAFEQQQAGKRLPINSWVNFNYPNLIALYAVPVKKSGTDLKTGEFTASAMLYVDYQ
ncbi:fimbrial protein [Serratia marcescens subsp. marcescens Db11]|uniref:Fimbrial protein n=1 Tax=Serratia marcescens subsp. marcescens Db11 TaxID=273526 RepID=A0ABC9IR43_SERMA|nr:fimbrial protein [Serratia marcescens]CDG15004.1 fimbrial protein [Serratia marcescens subsp. marcescens Db11]